MLYLYTSNQLSVLSTMLTKVLELQPLENPLARETILVQSPGMAQWLRLTLAEHFGIAANVDFPLPASFIWQMFTRVLPDVPDSTPYNKAAVRWQLMTLLPGLLDDPAFAPLAGYLAAGGETAPQLRQWQLCEQIADLFDQYLVYRPDWIAAWEAGDNLPAALDPAGEQAWQPILWRALVARVAKQTQGGAHRAGLYDAFIAALDPADARVCSQLPSRVMVFGISALPPRYVEALQALAQCTEVHLFVTNPSQQFWGDIMDQRTLARLAQKSPAGQAMADSQGEVNPLLASMGKQGRDFIYHLYELPAEEFEAFVPPADDSLLHQLQADILTLRDRGSGVLVSDNSRHKTPVRRDDDSLQCHLCHSPMRELEVLHDRLLAMFDADPTLKPRDVVVMMADVNSYGPAIQAVFGARGQIPFSISDRSATQESPLLLSLLSLLRLPRSRLGAAELLTILEVPAVLAKFELNADAFDQLRLWVQEAGIRWGLDQGYPARFDLPPLQGNHWLYGLRRLLLGYAMGDGAPVQGILPYAAVEGQSAVWLGKLAAFVDTLAHWLPQLESPAPLAVWQERIVGLIEDCYQAEEEDERRLQQVRDQLQRWQTELDATQFAGDLSAELVYDLMQQALTEQRSSQRFLAGQVNFCTLMPMRAIPFRHICLLGMNDGVYPRTLQPMGFDLMARERRRGDRSRRDDDRYLFLEALLSAGEGLYISYQGHSVQDNSERVPSVLVAELLDYCAQGFVLQGDEDQPEEIATPRLLAHLQIHHPLVPYSPRYFHPEADSRLFTYQHEWLPALTPGGGSHQFRDTPLALPEAWQAPQRELDLAEMLRFYRQPASYFLNRRLKVWFEELDAGLEEHEPFELDGLQRYQLRHQLLTAQLAGQSLPVIRERLQLSGQLPQGAFGQLLLDEHDTEMRELAGRLRPYWQAQPQTCEIDLRLPEGRLLGWQVLHAGRQLVFKPNSLNGRDWLQAWIRHLCLCASDQGDSLLVSPDECWALLPVEADTARRYLSALIQDWEAGMQRPLPFFPRTAWAWVGGLEKKGPDEARSKARSAFTGGFSVSGEGEDLYVRRCFPQLDDTALDALGQLAERHLLPLLAHRESLEA